MPSYDRMSALFWMGMGIAICVESIRVGQGSLSAPGPGLIPLGCGLLLVILGLILFLHSFKIEVKGGEVLEAQKIHWGKLIFVLGALISYALLMDFLGFMLVTIIWMGFLCRLGKIGWRTTVFISIITTFLSYILFIYLLGIRFPHGILGFLLL